MVREAPAPPSPRQGHGVPGLTGLLRTCWQLKSQTHGPSSESSSQTPPRCWHSSCSHSPSSPEPEPPEPHSAVGGAVTVCPGPHDQHPTPTATPTPLAGSRPGLLDLRLLLARSLAELTDTPVGDAVAAAHGPRWGVLTPRTHTPARQAHGPKGTHHIPTGLCGGQVFRQHPRGQFPTVPAPHPHSRQCPAEATWRLIWCVQAWT